MVGLIFALPLVIIVVMMWYVSVAPADVTGGRVNMADKLSDKPNADNENIFVSVGPVNSQRGISFAVIVCKWQIFPVKFKGSVYICLMAG